MTPVTASHRNFRVSEPDIIFADSGGPHRGISPQRTPTLVVPGAIPAFRIAII